MTLDQFCERLAEHEWHIALFGSIRTGKPSATVTSKIVVDLCPLAAVTETTTGTDVETFAAVTGLDPDLCSDIISAADNNAGVDHENNPVPFTVGRHVESLPSCGCGCSRRVNYPTEGGEHPAPPTGPGRVKPLRPHAFRQWVTGGSLPTGRQT